MIPETEPTVTSSTISKWKILRFLDAGANSEYAFIISHILIYSINRAYIAEDPEDSKAVVLKVTKLSMSSALKREATFLKSLAHENLIGFKDYQESVEIEVSNTKTAKVALLALEYAENGDILSLIQQKKRLPEKLARSYFQQIINALAFLHKNHIAHRDIKPENLLLDRDYCIRLADFGFAEKFIPGQKSVKIVGTPTYFPPEMHEKLPHSPESADLFAAGMILFILVSGYMPFESAHQSDKAYRLFRRDVDRFWSFHEGVMKNKDPNLKFNQQLKDLLNRIYDPDPEKRISLEEIHSHKWTQGETIENSLIKACVSQLP